MIEHRLVFGSRWNISGSSFKTPVKTSACWSAPSGPAAFLGLTPGSVSFHTPCIQFAKLREPLPYLFAIVVVQMVLDKKKLKKMFQFVLLKFYGLFILNDQGSRLRFFLTTWREIVPKCNSIRLIIACHNITQRIRIYCEIVRFILSTQKSNKYYCYGLPNAQMFCGFRMAS